MREKEINSLENGTFYGIINDNSSVYGRSMCGECGNCKEPCEYGIHITAVRGNYTIVGGVHDE